MIAIGADHGGFKAKEELKKYYKDELVDFGAFDETRGLEEPEVALRVAEAVANKECEAGILICRSGVGMTIMANKVCGIKCALCYNEATARSAKEHNNANIIAFGSDFISVEDMIKMIDIWKNSEFLNGIYAERLDILDKYEKGE